MKILYFCFALFNPFISLNVIGQENEAPIPKEAFSKSHALGIGIGHAHVFEGRDAEGNKKVLALPMWPFYSIAP